MQKYSPRRKNSVWSEINKKRAQKMIKEIRMTKEGLLKIKEAKKYPLYAKRMDQEGVVRVKFTLRRDGTLKEGVRIIKKCRYKVLNDEAIKTIVRANPYSSFPSELKKDEMAFTIDLDFRLEGW